MAKQVTMNISMPPSLGEFVKRRMASKGYDNTSEYIRQLVREDQRREDSERLESLLLEGLAPGTPTPATEEWWEQRRAKLAAKARRRGSV